MEIEYIKKSEILEYAIKAPDSFDADIPITKGRAASQSENPYAKSGDILLMVARDGKKLLSYLGILPGIVQGDPGRQVYWNTCWWSASDTPRGTGLALLREFISLTGGKVAFSDLGEKTSGIVKTLGFRLQEREGVLLRLRSGLHKRSLVRSYGGKFSFIVKLFRYSGMFRIMDALYPNVVVHKIAKRILPDKSFIISDEKPGQDIIDLISGLSTDCISKPGKEFFDWIYQSRWLHPLQEDPDQIFKRYFFSNLAEEFRYTLGCLYDDEKLVAAGLLSIRDGVVKTLYFWYIPEYRQRFFNGISKHIFTSKNLHTLITFDPEFYAYLKGRSMLKYRVKYLKRYTAAGDPDLEKLKFSDGDGDYCFW